MAELDADELVRRYREQRVITMSLADQIEEDRWRQPVLSGDRTLHDVLSHMLAWDEWAIAVFELSALRPLPPVLVQAVRDVDAFNARAIQRQRNLRRDDIIAGLQTAVDRVIYAARATGGADWANRRIQDLATPGASADGTPAPGPRIGRIVRTLTEHERTHDDEIMAAFGVEPHLERFQEEDQTEGEERE